MFSVRGVKVFLTFFIPGFVYVLYERLSDTGIVAAIDRAQMNASDDGLSYVPVFSVLGACAVFYLIGFVAALLHDIAFRMGKFLPLDKRREYPHLASVWDRRKLNAPPQPARAPVAVRKARLRFALLSLFYPIFTTVPPILAVVAFSTGKPDVYALILALVVGLGIGFVFRLRYAGRYVATKGRVPGFRFLALAGIWGWLILFQLEDRSSLSRPEQDRLGQS